MNCRHCGVEHIRRADCPWIDVTDMSAEEIGEVLEKPHQSWKDMTLRPLFARVVYPWSAASAIALYLRDPQGPWSLGWLLAAGSWSYLSIDAWRRKRG